MKNAIEQSRRDDLDIGEAMHAIKQGHRVRRAGWVDRDRWVAYSPGVEELAAESFWSAANQRYAAQQPGGVARVLPCITMKKPCGAIQMGWSPTMSDTLATDWYVMGDEDVERVAAVVEQAIDAA